MIAAKYRTRDEAFELKELLEKNQIHAVAKRQGLPRFLGGLMFHQVQISKKDSDKAKPIVDGFHRKEDERREKEKKALETCCPRCKSKNIFVYRKNFLERIFYIGVTVRSCSECSMKWFT